MALPIPTWPPQLGAAFKNRDTGTPDRLWVVCSRSTPNDEVVVIPLIPIDRHSDSLCCIGPEECPCVSETCAAGYVFRASLTHEAFRIMVRQGWYDPFPNVPPAVLDRIQNGALASQYVPEALRKLIRIAQNTLTRPTTG